MSTSGVMLSELITVLKATLDAHGDMPVLCTWESLRCDIDGIYVDHEGRLLIDSDSNFYEGSYRDPNVPRIYPTPNPPAGSG